MRSDAVNSPNNLLFIPIGTYSGNYAGGDGGGGGDGDGGCADGACGDGSGEVSG